MVIHTDHANLVRLEYLPLDRIDAKHYRWLTEASAGGCLLLYRPGSGVLHRLPDALSRNPPERDFLVIARTSEWTQLRMNIRGVEDEVRAGILEDFDPPRHTVDVSKEIHPDVTALEPAQSEKERCTNCSGRLPEAK